MPFVNCVADRFSMDANFLRVKLAPELRTYPMRLELAGFYSQDASDFYSRFRATYYSNELDFQGVKSRRVKAYIDLRMALEATLKALVCLRAPRSLAGRPLVQMVQGYSHNISRLKVDALRGLAIDPRASQVIDDCNLAGIGLRYQFEAMNFREPDDQRYYDTIGSDYWMRSLEEIVGQGLERLRTAIGRRQKIVSMDIVLREMRERPMDYQADR